MPVLDPSVAPLLVIMPRPNVSSGKQGRHSVPIKKEKLQPAVLKGPKWRPSPSMAGVRYRDNKLIDV